MAFKCQVQHMSGTSIELEVSPELTVAELKGLLKAQLPCDELTRKLTSVELRLADLSLSDEETVAEVIPPDSVLQALYKTHFVECSEQKEVDDCLLAVSIPESTTSLVPGAFYGCDKLAKVLISDSVHTIGASAFESCSDLRSIEIGGLVTSIAARAFAFCGALSSIELPSPLASLGDAAFMQSGLEEIYLPDGLTMIPNDCFFACTALRHVRLPSKTTQIGSGAFISCGALEGLLLPESMTSIGDGAFANCGKLKELRLPSSVVQIGSCTFENCPADLILASGIRVAASSLERSLKRKLDSDVRTRFMSASRRGRPVAGPANSLLAFLKPF